MTSLAMPALHNVSRFEALLARHLGLQSDESQRDHVNNVLLARMRVNECADVDSYCRLLHDGKNSAEMQVLADEFAVRETFFFRGNDHWQAFTESVLPRLLVDLPHPLRILCAGCASGEEPYTIAILLQEHMSDLPPDAVEVLGIDASPAQIDKARRGCYSPWSLRSTSAEIKARYFQLAGTQFELSEAIRQRVRFETRNLLDEDARFWHVGAFDVIFCRNVFIYFTPEAMQKVVDQFSGALVGGGFLFLGHSETLRGVSRAYHLRNHGDTFYYQRRYQDEPVDADPLFALWRRTPDEQVTEVSAELTGDDSWVEATQRVSERIAKVIAAAAQPPGVAMNVARDANAVSDELAQVLTLYGQERYGDVEALLDSHVLRGNSEALLLLAATQTTRGHIVSAEKTCRALLEKDEFSAEAHYLFALCREHVGDVDGAKIQLQSALYLNPCFAMPHFQLGRLARRSGNAAAAIRHFAAAHDFLLHEDAARLILFGGGFSRAALLQICSGEIDCCDKRSQNKGSSHCSEMKQ